MDEPTIHETEVDGVRCVWLDAARPFTAVLLFRVGMMDEPLRMRGISHLVAHLGLLRFHGTETTFNGYVALRETGFVGEGPPDQVGTFLQEVCTSLQDLPMDRIELETSVLRQEEAMAGTDPASVIATYYFGPRGLGVTTFPQFGLHWLGPSELEDWVSRYFTKENA
ncbi:MAG: insulinase family protein, partial [Acidimicrobiales bacterium]|nr:insulinase family protein [Acidimicrobiales bacterium]